MLGPSPGGVFARRHQGQSWVGSVARRQPSTCARPQSAQPCRVLIAGGSHTDPTAAQERHSLFQVCFFGGENLRYSRSAK